MSKSKRKPRIATARQGGSFDGVFDPLPPPLNLGEQATSPSPEDASAPAVSGPPQPGDPDYERIVQGNWNVPAWIRAKVRAIKDYDGTSQNEVVQAALARYIGELERRRGEPYPVQERHFR